MNTKASVCLVVCLLVASTADAQTRRVRNVPRPVPNQYIVVLATNDDPESVGRESEMIHGGRLQAVFRNALHGFAIRVSAAAAERLANDPRVLFVEQDAVVQASETQVAPQSWGLDRIDQRNLPLDSAFTYTTGTTTVHVHVIDTGVWTTHVEFGGRASIGGDFVDDDLNPNTPASNDDGFPGSPDGQDCHGHGTHVAGTIAGETFGIAKNALVFGYRALGCGGSGSGYAVIAAVDAITATRHRPAVVNMSLGSAVSTALDAAVRRSISAGITYVVAAGNSGIDASNQSPARVEEAITVGATDWTDYRAGFSNYGPLVDLLAPGVGILSAASGSDTAIAGMSGTSMAAPHAAGVAALYLSQVGDRTPAQVSAALAAAATPGVVGNAGPGSPNLLLFSTVGAPPPVEEIPPPPPSPPPPPPPPPSNLLPTITLTSPSSGTSMTAPGSFTLAAAASDADGWITDVAFYINGSLLATDTAAPYSFVWSSVPVGNYTVTARATDNAGAVVTSASVTVKVAKNRGKPNR